MKTEKYDSNNAWGFGGSYGTYTTHDNGYVVKKGTACFRHLKGERFTRYYDDKGKQISKKEFDKATPTN